MARQQAGLLDELAADAVAPEAEKQADEHLYLIRQTIRKMGDDLAKPMATDPCNDTVTLTGMQWQELIKRISGLEQQVRWLGQRGNRHAKVIADLTARVSQLERQAGLRLYAPNEVQVTQAQLDDALQVSLGPSVSCGPLEACNHDLTSNACTLQVTSRNQPAKCRVCGDSF